MRIEGVKAANHNESLNRVITVSVTVDGNPWPCSKEWHRTYEYDGDRVIMWEPDGPEEGGEVD